MAERVGELTDYDDLDAIEAFEKNLICNICWLKEDATLGGFYFEYKKVHVII
jgi:hypothetical protein